MLVGAGWLVFAGAGGRQYGWVAIIRGVIRAGCDQAEKNRYAYVVLPTVSRGRQWYNQGGPGNARCSARQAWGGRDAETVRVYYLA